MTSNVERAVSSEYPDEQAPRNSMLLMAITWGFCLFLVLIDFLRFCRSAVWDLFA